MNKYGWRQTTIWARDEEWDKLKYVASSSGKTLSRYLGDLALKFINEHPNQVPLSLDRDSGFGDKRGEDYKRIGKHRSLIFKEEDLEVIKAFAKKNNCSVGQFLIGLVLGDN